MSNIIETLKNFNNIEIIVILIIIVVVAIIINSRIFKIFLTSVILLVLFLTFYGKVPSFSNFVDKFTNSVMVMKEEQSEIKITINDKVYSNNEFTFEESSNLPDEKKYTILNSEEDLSNIKEKDSINVEYKDINYKYEVKKIADATDEYDTSYNLIIVGNKIVYASLND